MKPAQDSETNASLKNLFIRVIRLEAKLDLMADENRVTVSSFFKFAVGVIFLEILNVVVHFLF